MSRGRRGGWQSLAGSSGQLWLELAFSTFPCFLLIQFPGSLWFILFLGTGLSGHFPRIGTLDYWGDTGVRKGKNQLRKGRFTTMPNLYISCRSVLHSYKFSPDLVGFTLKSDNFLSKIHICYNEREKNQCRLDWNARALSPLNSGLHRRSVDVGLAPPFRDKRSEMDHRHSYNFLTNESIPWNRTLLHRQDFLHSLLVGAEL